MWYWHWWQEFWNFYGIKRFDVIRPYLNKKITSIYRDIYCDKITPSVWWYQPSLVTLKQSCLQSLSPISLLRLDVNSCMSTLHLSGFSRSLYVVSIEFAHHVYVRVCWIDMCLSLWRCTFSSVHQDTSACISIGIICNHSFMYAISLGFFVIVCSPLSTLFIVCSLPVCPLFSSRSCCNCSPSMLFIPDMFGVCMFFISFVHSRYVFCLFISVCRCLIF